jgi:hypothetical protein
LRQSFENAGVPYGYCQCGCDQRTALSRTTAAQYGWVKDEPMRFIFNHANRRPIPVGKKFGILTILGRIEGTSSPSMVACLCDCGNRCEKPWKEVNRGNILSCNCNQGSGARNPDGLGDHPMRVILHNIHQRCGNPNHPRYIYYGARGIGPCSGWRGQAGFSHFLDDLGERSGPQYSVDRIDNDGGYWCGHCEECIANGWPANCRWATAKEQAENSRPWGTVINNYGSRSNATRTWQAARAAALRDHQ